MTRVFPSPILAVLMMSALVPAMPVRAEHAPTMEVRIASAGPHTGGAFAQDLAEVLGPPFSARLRVVPILSGSPALAMADLCAGKAELAVLPTDLPEVAAGCPRRKADARKRGLRLVARLGDDPAAAGRPWLLVAAEANPPAVAPVETLVALMFPNMNALAAGPRRQRWSGADVVGDLPGWTRDESAALWLAGIREQCRRRPTDGVCGSSDGTRK